MAAFDHPWILAAIPALLLLAALRRRGAVRRSAFMMPLPGAVRFPRTRRQQLAWLPEALRTTALVLLAIAAAGPHWGAVRMTDEARGIAIELVIDRSSSMSLPDLAYQARRIGRLDAVKTLAKEFLLGNGADLRGRAGDAIGLVAFAARAQSLSPLVSHNERMLARTIDSIDTARGAEDGTSIGDGVALAVARLRMTEEARAISFRSKIVILLTDGQENDGVRRLEDAGRLASRWNVRVYAIGIRPVPEGAQHEEEIGYGLDQLAAGTNGMAVMASDGAGLRRFFAAIDRLEPNLIPATALSGGYDAAEAALLLAFALVCAELGLVETWMRSAP